MTVGTALHPMIASPAIRVDGLTKWYGERCALDNISFEVSSGEIFALLGPNGAGKTTTVEILEGFRRPDAGTARVLDLDPVSDARSLRPRIGVMLQEGGLYPAITPREALHLFARFYAGAADPDELLRRVGLGDAAATRYRRLSGGQKQRLALALALLPRPEIVFLDEPTAGMDPQGRRTTWEIVEQLRDDGAAVLLTTHYLEEAERLADRVAIVESGRLVALDSPTALKSNDSSKVRLTTATPLDPGELRNLPSVTSVNAESGRSFVISTSDSVSLLAELTAAMRGLGVRIIDLHVGEGSLEDVYLRIISERFDE